VSDDTKRTAELTEQGKKGEQKHSQFSHSFFSRWTSVETRPVESTARANGARDPVISVFSIES
jgi:hypothetical protein